MTDLESAWQAALAAEHAAVFGYALLGARLSGPNRELALACATRHEELRDATRSAIGAAGLIPVPPEADYPSMYPVPDPAAARTLAVRLEDDCASAWRYLYFVAASNIGAQPTALRGVAQAALTASAVRATNWRVLISPAHVTVPFPGLG